MTNEFFDADQRHKVGAERLTRFASRESWSMSRQDFAVGLAQVFGRYVRVSYLRDFRDPENAAKYSVRATMACRSREDGMHFEVVAEVAPDGDVRIHGGNRLWHASNAVEMADHFALEAAHAYAGRLM